MCGIAGIIAWDESRRIDAGVLQSMSRAIAHRGPDAQGTFISPDGPIDVDRPQAALAHCRLAIIDLDPRANQPWIDDLGRVLVFNGEIYNYRELRDQLRKLMPDYRWRSQSDTEVIAASYACWGHACIERFNGMFALALWDAATRELFLARDRMGQKPLYYCFAPGAIAFASELGAISCVPWAPRRVDPSAVIEYLRWGNIGHSRTIWAGVHKLPAAAYITLTPGNAPETKTYFDANASVAIDDAAPVDTVRRLVRQAVARQLVADVPLGCFLSGGIDSSIIAASMKMSAPPDQPVLTFSIGFDDPLYDETAYAARVAQHLKTEHRQFTVHPNAADDLPRLAAAFSEPFADSSALPTHYLAQQTRQYVKVALSGDGGDELFGGYDRYRAMAAAARADSLPAFARVLLAGKLGRVIPGQHPKSLGARIKRFLAALDLPPAHRYAAYMTLFDMATLRELLTAGAAHWPDASHHDLAATFSQLNENRDDVRAALATDRITYLPDDLLAKVDRASMLHALEVRSPFMDHDLVTYAAGLPTPMLLRGGGKRMLREAFAPDLPAEVFARPKMGFAVPIGSWLRNELRPMLHDLLFAANSFASAHFRRPRLEAMIREHQTEQADHSQRLYALLMLELWWTQPPRQP